MEGNPWDKYGVGDLPMKEPLARRKVLCGLVALIGLLGICAAERPIDDARALIYKSRQAAYCLGVGKQYYAAFTRRLENYRPTTLNRHFGPCLISSMERCGEFETMDARHWLTAIRNSADRAIRWNQEFLTQTQHGRSAAEDARLDALDLRGRSAALACISRHSTVCETVAFCGVRGPGLFD